MPVWRQSPGYSPSFESSSDVSIRTCVVVSLSLSA